MNLMEIQSNLMKELALSTLERMSGLDGLSTVSLGALSALAVSKRFAAGESIFEHLSTSTDVYVIASGQVRVHMSANNGRVLTYQILPPGEMFGELAALGDGPRTASAVAETEVLLLQLYARDFRALLTQHSDFSLLVINKLARMNRWLMERLFEYHTYDVRGRVYAELLRITLNGRCPANVTDKDLASRVGTTRENVTRIHRELKKSGILDRSGSTLTVLNEPLLRDRMKNCEFG